MAFAITAATSDRPNIAQDRFNPSLAACVFLLLDAAVVQPRVVQTVGRNSTLLYGRGCGAGQTH